MVRLLACDCTPGPDGCTHWEIVQMPDDNSIHLRCKTCDRVDELDSFTIHEKAGNQVQWVEVEEE